MNHIKNRIIVYIGIVLFFGLTALIGLEAITSPIHLWTSLMIVLALLLLTLCLLSWLLSRVFTPIGQLTELLQVSTQDGLDLSRRLTIQHHGQSTNTAQLFNNFLTAIHDLILNTSKNVNLLLAAAKDLSHKVSLIDASLAQETQADNAMKANIELLTSSIDNITHSAHEA